MGVTSTERLRAYLAALPPRAQSLLMREFERAARGGENAAVAAFVLGELRKLVRSDGDLIPRTDEPMRLAFQPLEPFLIDGSTARPGTIRRTLLLQVWRWLENDGAPAATARLVEIAAARGKDPDAAAMAISDFQRVAAVELSALAETSMVHRTAMLRRIGPQVVSEDIVVIADLLRSRDVFQALAGNLPAKVSQLGASQLASFQAALAAPMLQTPSLMPFALTLAMRRLSMPWQIVRLATHAAGSDNEQRVAAMPQAISVAMVIQDLAGVASRLRDDLRHSRFEPIGLNLKTLHDGIRGLLSEIDIRPDSIWGRQIAALRIEVSGALRPHIDGLPARVRRLLRQRAPADISASARIDPAEAGEAVALVQMVERCRAYASELALNEVSTRVHNELLQYVGPTTDALIATLRGGDDRSSAFRRQQADAAIALSRILYGEEHAARMQRSADHALAFEPQVRSA